MKEEITLKLTKVVYMYTFSHTTIMYIIIIYQPSIKINKRHLLKGLLIIGQWAQDPAMY